MSGWKSAGKQNKNKTRRGRGHQIPAPFFARREAWEQVDFDAGLLRLPDREAPLDTEAGFLTNADGYAIMAVGINGTGTTSSNATEYLALSVKHNNGVITKTDGTISTGCSATLSTAALANCDAEVTIATAAASDSVIFTITVVGWGIETEYAFKVARSP